MLITLHINGNWQIVTGRWEADKISKYIANCSCNCFMQQLLKNGPAN